jgi:hypothetical protein
MSFLILFAAKLHIYSETISNKNITQRFPKKKKRFTERGMIKEVRAMFQNCMTSVDLFV